MRARLKQIPLLKMTVADPEFMQGAPTQAPLSVYLRGDDMAELQRLNEEVVAKIKAVPGAVDVDSTLETGQPEMAASVNRELAADLGFDVGSVAMQLRGMVEGIVPTRLREDDKEYDIRVRLAPEFRNDFESIARTPLYSPTGAVVRARDIVRMKPEVGPAAIEREAAPAPGQDQHRAVGPPARRCHRRCRQGDGRHRDAGDDAAKELVAELIDEIGFAPVDTGTLSEGGRLQQPGSDVYNVPLTGAEGHAAIDHG